MHRCLELPDTAFAIAEYLHGSELVAFAATCHSLYGTANPVVWSTLLSLRPLLRLFPDDIWKHDDGTPHTFAEKVILRRSLEPSDWERFMQVARHVKLLVLRLDESTDVETVMKLVASKPTEPFFPNLLTLRWTDSKVPMTNYFSMFIGPRLTTLEVATSAPEAFDEDIQHLDVTCPYLEDLQLSSHTQWHRLFFPWATSDSGDKFAKMLKGLNHLKVLSSPWPLPADAIVHLATLPSFKGFRGAFIVDEDLVSQLSTLHVFPALERLELRTHGLSYELISFLEQIEATAVWRLDLWFEREPAADVLDSLIPTLEKYTSSMRRMAFLFRTELDPKPDYSTEFSLGTNFKGLLSFHQMEYLCIRSGSFEVDNEVLEQIWTAMPELESLILDPGQWFDRNFIPKLKVEDILQLVSHCRKLQYIGIPFDAREPIYFNDRFNWSDPAELERNRREHSKYRFSTDFLKRPARKLWFSKINHCPITDPSAFSLYLSTYWPVYDVGFLIPRSPLEFQVVRDRISDEVGRDWCHRLAVWGSVDDKLRMCIAARSHTMLLTMALNSTLLDETPEGTNNEDLNDG